MSDITPNTPDKWRKKIAESQSSDDRDKPPPGSTLPSGQNQSAGPIDRIVCAPSVDPPATDTISAPYEVPYGSTAIEAWAVCASAATSDVTFEVRKSGVDVATITIPNGSQRSGRTDVGVAFSDMVPDVLDIKCTAGDNSAGSFNVQVLIRSAQ